MKHALIIGAGFAGISAAKALGKQRKELETLILDKNRYSNFLPLLPDLLGRGIGANLLEWELSGLKRSGVEFLNEEAVGIDLEKKEVRTNTGKPLSYDYLIIACGSETNFYGNEAMKVSSLKMDDTLDAGRIFKRLEKDDFSHCVICGGGYTGVEIASNLRLYFEKRKKDKRIILVERAPQVLAALPHWMRSYVLDNLKRQKIEVLTDTSIVEISEQQVRLSSGAVLEDVLLIWAAGVKVADFLKGLDLEKNPQGRLQVDEYLRVNESCFVLGDAAYFRHKGSSLRMAVQFSIAEGELAAENIIRHARGEPLKRYEPLDLGFIIPMANNRSCGEVLGIRVKGVFATCLHYCMCIYRSFGLKNKRGLFVSLLRGGAR